MIDHATIMNTVMPGQTTEAARDLRPLRRHGFARRLHMFAMVAQAKPGWCDDPGRFRAALDRLAAMTPPRRDQLLDDIDMAAWIHGLPLHPATPIDRPVTVASFENILDRHATSAQGVTPDCEPTPRILLGEGPPHVIEAVQAAGKALDDPGIDPAAERVALSGQVQAALATMATLWPGMAETVRRHIRAIAIGPEIYATSNWNFAGTVLFSRVHIARLAIGEIESFGESLAHETSHQMLFCVQEIERLIVPDTGGTFISPWSGKARPLAVYSHIPLTYLVVAEYLLRRRDSDQEEAAPIRARLRKIMAGLDAFYATEPGRPYLTPLGCALHDQVRARFNAQRAKLMD